jgi:hypothetical protein
MDFSICSALNWGPSPPLQAITIYDVACQRYKNFLARVSNSSSLSLPTSLTIIPAVGSFHLSAHVPGCFALYSLHFIKGSAQNGGELIETLWAPLNKIAGSTRVMTRAHRQEVLDSHIQDNNWKKLTSSTQTLMKKLQAASAGVIDTRQAYTGLTESLDQDLVSAWTEAYSLALEERGEHLKIFEVRMEKGEVACQLSRRKLNFWYLISAPSLGEIRLQLTEEEIELPVPNGAVGWLVNGMNLEQALCVTSALQVLVFTFVAGMILHRFKGNLGLNPLSPIGPCWQRKGNGF